MCVKGVWGNGVTFPQRFFASFLASKKGRYFSLCTPSLCEDRNFRVPQTGGVTLPRNFFASFLSGERKEVPKRHERNT